MAAVTVTAAAAETRLDWAAMERVLTWTARGQVLGMVRLQGMGHFWEMEQQQRGSVQSPDLVQPWGWERSVQGSELASQGSVLMAWWGWAQREGSQGRGLAPICPAQHDGRRGRRKTRLAGWVVWATLTTRWSWLCTLDHAGSSS